MGKVAKVALGCGCLALVGVVVAVWLLYGACHLAARRVGDMAGGIQAKTEQIDRWEQKANANAYTAPVDGVIPEARLVKFLAARKQVFAVFERYQAELKQLEARSKSGGDTMSATEVFSAGSKLAEVLGEIRLAQAKSLADLGMSEAEYRDLQMAVYRSAWASESLRQSGKLPSEAVADAGKQMQEAMQQGLAEAQKQGVPGVAGLSEEDQKKLQESMAGLGETARALDVPRANVELFRKYEADIRKYAMSGLEFLGL